LYSVEQPLSRHKVFGSENVEEIRAKMSELYNDSVVQFSLAKGQRQLAHEMFVVPLGGIMLTSFHWPFGVRAATPCLEDTFDFCIPIEGVGEIMVGSESVSYGHETGVVLSPNRPMRFELGARNICLNVKVPRTLLEGQLRALIGRDLSEPLEFDSVMQYQREQCGSLWRCVRFAIDEIDRNASMLTSPLFAERFSETVLTGFLYAQPNSYSHLLHREVLTAEPYYIRRIEEYIAAHCEQPITSGDLAAIAGVSMSALYAGFKRYRGYTPLEFLKNTRLHRVREALLIAPPGATVKEIAKRWGFNHLGRFSRDYRHRFGEAPSETLARSAQG
jgi:AraC-like DNA-binding protein